MKKIKNEGFLEAFSLSEDDWLIIQDKYRPSHINKYEANFTLGNGYCGLRACLEENPWGSYRGLYIAGVFDKAEASVKEIVKCPVWTDFSVWVEGSKFSVDTCKVLSHCRILDMKKGILHRETRLQDKRGRIILLQIKRIVFMHDVHGGIMDIKVTPENFSGDIRVITMLNGNVVNTGYYPGEKTKHLVLSRMIRGNNFKYLEMKTRDDNIAIGMASSLDFNNSENIHFTKANRIYGEKISTELVFNAQKNTTYSFTSYTSIYTTREISPDRLMQAVLLNVNGMLKAELQKEIQKHIDAWQQKWARADIVIVGDIQSQKSIRFNIYHLIIAAPQDDDRVGIGAKFLSGEGYKGHSFWDTEIFILPFFVYNFPDIARNLLMYRYHTLPGAFQNAKEMGYKGAKYAWESADTGVETTPSLCVNFDGSHIRVWTGDEEHHIVSDIPYAIFHYFLSTNDYDFLYGDGAEIFFQTTRFWESRVVLKDNKYHILEVIGPDEFHEHVDDNAYTNYLVKWHFEKAIKLYYEIKAKNINSKLLEKIKLSPEEVNKWQEIAENIYLNIDPDSGLIEQFKGYFQKREALIKSRGKNGMPLLPKGFSWDTIADTQFIKQADIVLLMYLLEEEFSLKAKKINYEYYEPRTLHKSSLSPNVYAIMGIEIGDYSKVYQYFVHTSMIDLNDIQGNAKDGIHAAAAGGAWNTVIHGFAGMRVHSDGLRFKPWLPKKWKKMSFSVMWKDLNLHVSITEKNISLFFDSQDEEAVIPVTVGDKKLDIKANKKREVEY